MQNQLLRWVNGRTRESVGVYWGALGICLAYRPLGERAAVVYIPAIKDVESSVWDEATTKLGALCEIKPAQIAFAVALSADDVFVKLINVPDGLDEGQVEQVAIVEAVANLPVPPEEICLDFIREDGGGADAAVKIAFCRRERIDEILGWAEELGVPVHVVDRDVQAIHDVIANRISLGAGVIEYPFGVVLTEVSPRFVICLDPTNFEIYPIRLQRLSDGELGESLSTQLENCWTRCKMSRINVGDQVKQIFVIGDDFSSLDGLSVPRNDGVFRDLVPFSIVQHVDISAPNGYLPEEVLLTALGMAGRNLE